MSGLTGLLEQYRAIFRKRKMNTNTTAAASVNGGTKNTKSHVIVDNLDHYKIISQNYNLFLCFMLTNLEINEIKRK